MYSLPRHCLHLLIPPYLQRLSLCGRVDPCQPDLLSDLEHGEGNGDPGGAREHPGWAVDVLLFLLVFGLLGGLPGLWTGNHHASLVLDQVDGGDGHRTRGHGDILCQHFILCGEIQDTTPLFTGKH